MQAQPQALAAHLLPTQAAGVERVITPEQAELAAQAVVGTELLMAVELVALAQLTRAVVAAAVEVAAQ